MLKELVHKTKFLYYLFVRNTVYLVAIALISGCQDAINVDLNSVASRIVIEGIITNKNDTVKIWVTKTSDYFNPQPNAYVTNADVSIADNHGNIFPLALSYRGYYYAKNLVGVIGYAYTLKVIADGAEYNAVSVMPTLITIDSLAYKATTDERDENAINCYFRDSAGINNYYQIELFKGDTLLNKNNRLFIYSDKYFDGRYNTFALNSRRFVEGKYNTGDTLTVQLLNIDKQTYEYYNILRSITSNGRMMSASTPGNPPNNISNGALGYFAAKSISEKKIVIK
jgi:hypothetical protein